MENYMTKKEVQDWADSLPEDARLCNNCLTQMIEVEEDEGKEVQDSAYNRPERVIYCPNELCDDDAQYRVS